MGKRIAKEMLRGILVRVSWLWRPIVSSDWSPEISLVQQKHMDWKSHSSLPPILRCLGCLLSDATWDCLGVPAGLTV